jgi:hypothetical protein
MGARSENPAERAETRRLVAWFDLKFMARSRHPDDRRVVRRHPPRDAAAWMVAKWARYAKGAGVDPGAFRLYQRPRR